MTHNDVLSRIRFMFDYSDDVMVAVFAAVEHQVDREQLSRWLAREEDPLYEPVSGRDLAAFLNGFILHKRGRLPGPLPVPEDSVDNNLIAKKLKIALNLQSEGMLRILKLAGFEPSNHVLSAFFRKPTHKHFRKLNDQGLTYFLQGLQKEHRP
jgi:uncharacterized protein YehS (DUF1456 family)